MSINVTVTIACDDWADRMDLERLLARRYNRYGIFVEADEAYADRDEQYELESMLGKDGDEELSEEEMVTDINQLLSHSNSARRDVEAVAARYGIPLQEALDTLQRVLFEPIKPGPDIAPPHGIPRPKTSRPSLPFMRPPTSGQKISDRNAKDACRQIVPCPRCGAEIGAWCKSPATDSMGSATMHRDRLELVDWDG